MVRVRMRIVEGGIMPVRRTEGAVCYDCFARLPYGMTIPAGARALVPLGFAAEVPRGLEIQIRPLGSMSRAGVDVCLGTVGADDRGECCACVVNCQEEGLEIRDGDRICQVAVRSVPDVVLVEEVSAGTGAKECA